MDKIIEAIKKCEFVKSVAHSKADRKANIIMTVDIHQKKLIDRLELINIQKNEHDFELRLDFVSASYYKLYKWDIRLQQWFLIHHGDESEIIDYFNV
jgi:hypothetical protein